MSDNTPTRAKVLRLAQDCDLAKVALASNGSFSTGQSILHECASTLRALSAELERVEQERDKARARVAAVVEAVLWLLSEYDAPNPIDDAVEKLRALAAIRGEDNG